MARGKYARRTAVRTESRLTAQISELSVELEQAWAAQAELKALEREVDHLRQKLDDARAYIGHLHDKPEATTIARRLRAQLDRRAAQVLDYRKRLAEVEKENRALLKALHRYVPEDLKDYPAFRAEFARAQLSG